VTGGGRRNGVSQPPPRQPVQTRLSAIVRTIIGALESVPPCPAAVIAPRPTLGFRLDYKGQIIDESSLNSLRPSGSLDDIMINSILSWARDLLSSQGPESAARDSECCWLDPTWYTRLCLDRSATLEDMDRWTRMVRWDRVKRILIPTRHPRLSHWIPAVVELPPSNLIYIHDSWEHTPQDITDDILSDIQRWSSTVLPRQHPALQPSQLSHWTRRAIPHSRFQLPGSNDCGLFCVLNLLHYAFEDDPSGVPVVLDAVRQGFTNLFWHLRLNQLPAQPTGAGQASSAHDDGDVVEEVIPPPPVGPVTAANGRYAFPPIRSGATDTDLLVWKPYDQSCSRQSLVFDSADLLGASAFFVAAEIWRRSAAGGTGSKRETTRTFGAFASARHFATCLLMQSPVRCYYEIIRADRPCKAYLDLEAVCSALQGQSLLSSTLKAWETLILARWPRCREECPRSLEPIVLDGSRRTSAGDWKVSFHVVFPWLEFPCNHSLLQDLANDLSGRDDLQSPDGRPFVDRSVYSRNRQFRLPCCWKLGDPSCTALQLLSGALTLPVFLQACITCLEPDAWKVPETRGKRQRVAAAEAPRPLMAISVPRAIQANHSHASLEAAILELLDRQRQPADRLGPPTHERVCVTYRWQPPGNRPCTFAALWRPARAFHASNGASIICNRDGTVTLQCLHQQCRQYGCGAVSPIGQVNPELLPPPSHPVIDDVSRVDSPVWQLNDGNITARCAGDAAIAAFLAGRQCCFYLPISWYPQHDRPLLVRCLYQLPNRTKVVSVDVIFYNCHGQGGRSQFVTIPISSGGKHRDYSVRALLDMWGCTDVKLKDIEWIHPSQLQALSAGGPQLSWTPGFRRGDTDLRPAFPEPLGGSSPQPQSGQATGSPTRLLATPTASVEGRVSALAVDTCFDLSDRTLGSFLVKERVELHLPSDHRVLGPGTVTCSSCRCIGCSRSSSKCKCPTPSLSVCLRPTKRTRSGPAEVSLLLRSTSVDPSWDVLRLLEYNFPGVLRLGVDSVFRKLSAPRGETAAPDPLALLNSLAPSRLGVRALEDPGDCPPVEDQSGGQQTSSNSTWLEALRSRLWKNQRDDPGQFSRMEMGINRPRGTDEDTPHRPACAPLPQAPAPAWLTAPMFSLPDPPEIVRAVRDHLCEGAGRIADQCVGRPDGWDRAVEASRPRGPSPTATLSGIAGTWEVGPSHLWHSEPPHLRPAVGHRILQHARDHVTGYRNGQPILRPDTAVCRSPTAEFTSFWDSPLQLSALNVGFRGLKASMRGVTSVLRRRRPDILFLSDVRSTRNRCGRVRREIEDELEGEWRLLTEIAPGKKSPVGVGALVHASLLPCISPLPLPQPAGVDLAKWTRAVQGRILILQCKPGDTPQIWWFVGIYQHALHGSTSEMQMLFLRALSHLSEVAASQQVRLILLGDANAAPPNGRWAYSPRSTTFAFDEEVTTWASASGLTEAFQLAPCKPTWKACLGPRRAILDRVWFSPASSPVSRTQVHWIADVDAETFDHAVITVCIPKSHCRPGYASQVPVGPPVTPGRAKIDNSVFHMRKDAWAAALGPLLLRADRPASLDPFQKLDWACRVASSAADAFHMHARPRRAGGRAFAFRGHRALLREINAIAAARRLVHLALHRDPAFLHDSSRAVRWRITMSTLDGLLRRSTHGTLPTLDYDLALCLAPAQAVPLACWLEQAKQAIASRRQTIKEAVARASTTNVRQLRARLLSGSRSLDSVTIQKALGKRSQHQRMWGLTASLPTGLTASVPSTEVPAVIDSLLAVPAATSLRRVTLSEAVDVTHLQLWFSSTRAMGDFLNSGPMVSDSAQVQWKITACSTPSVVTSADDILSAQELHLAREGMDSFSVCANCGGSQVQPVVCSAEGTGAREAQRTIKFWCNSCSTLHEGTRQGDPPQCPLSDTLLRSCRRIPPGIELLLRKPIDMDTLELYLSRLPNGRSPGQDGIPYEFFKHGPPELKEILLEAVNLALTTGAIPDAWRGGIVHLLLKKDVSREITDWRPVVLLSTAYKIVSFILNDRLSRALETHNVLDEAQEGARRGRNAKRQVSKLLHLFADAKRRRQKQVVLYIDFKNAFNSVNHRVLFQILRAYGLPEADVCLLEELYK